MSIKAEPGTKLFEKELFGVLKDAEQTRMNYLSENFAGAALLFTNMPQSEKSKLYVHASGVHEQANAGP